MFHHNLFASGTHLDLAEPVSVPQACTFPYEFIEDVSSVPAVIEELHHSPYLSVDCEGVRLGRYGKLCLVQIATATKVYIFDIVKLQQAVFTAGLKNLLENESLPKYFFDCKEDCNALYHQYRVDVRGIQDLQLLDVVVRKSQGKNVEFVNGLARCMSYNLIDCGFSKAEKDAMHFRFDLNSEFWLTRPLDAQSLRYAATDVFYLPQLKDALCFKTSISENRIVKLLKYASKRYADHFRRNNKYKPGSEYIRTARFPLNIIPKFSNHDGSFLPFPEMSRRCQDCGIYCRRRDLSEHDRTQCIRCSKIDGFTIYSDSDYWAYYDAICATILYVFIF